MSNYVFCVKGVSGSGKSSRVFQLFNFFKEIGLTISDFEFINFENKSKKIGYLIEELDIVFIGKVYSSGDIERWQGYDVVTGYFGKAEYFSEFLKENSSRYSFVIEGAGITGTNRLRPLFLYNYCGFKNIFMQYYNYNQNQKHEYLKRIVGRSGKEPTKGTMWEKCLGFERESEMALSECGNVDCKTFHSYNLFDTPIEDFGVKFFKFLGAEDYINDFIEFVNDLDYVSKNKFENF